MIRTAALALAIALPAAAIAAPGSPTHFTRDPALLKAKERQLVEGVRSQSPQAADALEKAFAQDIIAQLQPSFRETGLDSNDMADMTTAYWINAWEAANGIVGRKTASALVRGARNQIAGMMAKNPATAGMTDAQKQDVADTMLLQGLMIAVRMKSAAAKGPEVQRQMSDTIAKEAQQVTKTDLRSLALTADGFRPRGAEKK